MSAASDNTSGYSPSPSKRGSVGLRVLQVVLLSATGVRPASAWAQGSNDEAPDVPPLDEPAGTTHCAPSCPAQVTVRGKRPLLAHGSAQPTAASTVLTRRDFRHAGESAADLLRQAPGLQSTSGGAASDYSTVSIRGATATQTPVYLAGIRINDEIAGIADLSTLPLWMVDRVEVYRGNAPGVADQFGLGGAVFFEPKTPRTDRVGAQVLAGSFGERAGSLAFEVAGTRAAALVALRRHQADNDYRYTNDQGQRFALQPIEQRRVNANFTDHDGWAVGKLWLGPTTSRRRGGPIRVTTVFNGFDREQGVSDGFVAPALQARARLRRLLGGASAHIPCGASACNLELASSALVGNTSLHDPARELWAPRTTELHHQGQRFAERASLGWEWRHAHLGLAAEVESDRLRIDRVSNTGRRAAREALRVSASPGWEPADRLELSGTLAVACTATRGEFTRFGEPLRSRSTLCETPELNARIGASFAVTGGVELLANAARATRTPSLGELYGAGPGLDGNPALEPERSVNLDLGTRGHFGGDVGAVSVDLFTFIRWADNLLRLRRVSTQSLAPFNVASARIRGAELGVASQSFGHLGTRTALTAIDAQETTADLRLDPTVNDVLPLSPRLMVWQRLEIFDEQLATNLGFAAAGVDYTHRASSFADPAGLTVLPEQHLFDVYATFGWVHPEVRLTASVRNVANAAVLDVLLRPRPGRSGSVVVEAWW